MTLLASFWSAIWRVAVIYPCALVVALVASHNLSLLGLEPLAGLVLWVALLGPPCWFFREWRLRYCMRAGSLASDDSRAGFRYLLDWAEDLLLATLPTLALLAVTILPVWFLDSGEAANFLVGVAILVGIFGTPTFWVVLLVWRRRRRYRSWRNQHARGTDAPAILVGSPQS